MTNAEKTPPAIVSAPHLAEGTSTRAVMWTAALCLAPSLVWGLAVFGVRALLVMAAAVGGAVITELAVNALRGRATIGDGSAFLSGLIIGLSLPPAAPLYVPLCASVFAMAVVKHAFGGLGANWMNPAMAGRAFVLLSFPAAMRTWDLPATLAKAGASAADALTGATPLGFVKKTLIEVGARDATASEAAALRLFGGPADLLSARGFPGTPFDAQLTGWFNGLFGSRVKAGYFDLFFGNTPGCIGEVSIFLLLIGAAVLIARKIVSWEVPASLLGTFALLVWIFGGVPFASGLFRGDVFFHLFSGGIVFCAFFVATDHVSGPLTRAGRIVFGAGVGLIAFLVRIAGSMPEGASVAVIVMNMFVPVIDRICKPRRTMVGRETAP